MFSERYVYYGGDGGGGGGSGGLEQERAMTTC